MSNVSFEQVHKTVVKSIVS